MFELQGERMRKLTRAALVGGGLLAGWIGWGLYSGRSAEEVPYEVRSTFNDVEIRAYPGTVRAETVAPDELRAFRRLFDYITGANEQATTLSMTTPVATSGGSKIPMTAPVQTEGGGFGSELRMAFYLPPEYDVESAPKPTDPSVELRAEPPRTVAAIQFSWFTPEWRVRRYRRKLLAELKAAGYETAESPFLLRYDDPGTPPFMRRNEVAVEIDADER